MNDHPPDRRAIRRAMIVMAIATAATTIVGTGVALTVQGRLPDPIATGWGPDGANNFQALATTLWVTAGLLIGLGLLPLAVIVRADPSSRHRLTGIMAGLVTGLGIGIYTAILMQIGLDDPRHARDPLLATILGVVGGIAGGAIAARACLRSGR